MEQAVPYLRGIVRVDRDPPDQQAFPFHFSWFRRFELAFETPVTFFVGENGSGKSTLLEALAVLCELPIGGGSRNELGSNHAPEETSELARHLRPSFRRRPKDGYFFRAEYYAHFASLLESRARDPDFMGNPYGAYGGRSLHTRSHGESFLELMTNRFREGLFLMDEPESALSPQRQLTLLALIAKLAQKGASQFVIATHSPILLTYPGAVLISFDDDDLTPVELKETPHYYITRDILDNPERYWRHLRPKEGDEEE